ncbi:MAG: hypothetical protein U1F57_05795 [bacterium]
MAWLNGVAGTVKGPLRGCLSVLRPTHRYPRQHRLLGLHRRLDVFKLIDVTIGLRADPVAEVDGLDIPEVGLVGYSGIHLDKVSESPTSR